MRFGTDGVRGAAYTELTTAFVTVLGRAAAEVLGTGEWIIGRDTRESGPEFERALADGLLAAGATVRLAGVVPTPAIARASVVRRAPAAMITASHNPFADNGVKLFAAGGLKLDDATQAAVETRLDELLAADAFRVAPGPDPARSGRDTNASSDPAAAADSVLVAPGPDATRSGRDTNASSGPAAVAEAVLVAPGPDPSRSGRDTSAAQEDPAIAREYADWVTSLFPAGCLAGLAIVLDCANGAMSQVAPMVTERLGALVELINAAPDGRNINADCGATSPGDLAGALLVRGADLGLAFDGDGDRVIAVDQHGQTVDGDRMLALAALQLRDAEALTGDTVVVTVMSNLGLRHAMAAARIGLVETAVGDRYVLEALDAGGWSLGGEQSGHLIYRDLATTGDGLLAGLRLAQHVNESGRTLAELAGAVMTGYPQVLVNIPVAERHPGIVDELAPEIAEAEAALAGDGRVLVRPSGTEPLIRVMVEAPTTDVAAATAESLAAVVRARFA